MPGSVEFLISLLGVAALGAISISALLTLMVHAFSAAKSKIISISRG